MAYTVMVYIGMTYIVMDYIVMACIVMAYVSNATFAMPFATLSRLQDLGCLGTSSAFVFVIAPWLALMPCTP